MKNKELRNIDEFPVQVRLPVAYVDMGTFNHVNNANYFRYFENARAQYFDDVGLSEMYTETGRVAVLAEVKCKFLQSLVYPDNLIVGAKISSIGQSSLIMEYLIVSEKIGVAAAGEGVLVMFDYNKSEKIRVPAELKIKIQELEKQKNRPE